jgi:hypothetical protein
MSATGNPPPMNRVDLSATMQSQLAAKSVFSKFKEEVASIVNSTLIWVILGYTKNLIKPTLVLWLIPWLACTCLLNLVVRIIVQLGST